MGGLQLTGAALRFSRKGPNCSVARNLGRLIHHGIASIPTRVSLGCSGLCWELTYDLLGILVSSTKSPTEIKGAKEGHSISNQRDRRDLKRSYSPIRLSKDRVCYAHVRNRVLSETLLGFFNWHFLLVLETYFLGVIIALNQPSRIHAEYFCASSHRLQSLSPLNICQHTALIIMRW